MIATTSMGHVFPGVLMDIKEKDAKVVSEVYILNLDISLSEKKHLLTHFTCVVY